MTGSSTRRPRRNPGNDPSAMALLMAAPNKGRPGRVISVRRGSGLGRWVEHRDPPLFTKSLMF
jgi:hypothetical protein